MGVMVSVETYLKCIDYAKDVIRYHGLRIEPEDVVHDLIIQHSNEDVDYKKEINQYIVGLTRAFSNAHLQNVAWTPPGPYRQSRSTPATDRQCKKCGEVLPEAMFEAIQRGVNKNVRRAVCVTCRKKQVAVSTAKYIKEKSGNKEWNEINKARIKQYKKNKKERDKRELLKNNLIEILPFLKKLAGSSNSQ